MKRVTSLQHPLVKHLVKLREDRRYRWKCGSVPLHGEVVIGELGGIFKTLLVKEGGVVPEGVKAEQVVEVTPAILRKVAGVQEPQELVAEAILPDEGDLGSKRTWIVLDGLQDPGNMGTLLRTALALGWGGAFIVEDSVDPFNAKALQAGKGAAFRLPLAFGSWSRLSKLLESKKQIVVGDVEGMSLEEVAFTEGVLILGNEAKGPSVEAERWGKKITIPMKGRMDSLNVAVAGAILMYQLGRGR